MTKATTKFNPDGEWNPDNRY